MNYSEFFRYFYIDGRVGGLIGYKSKEKIPEFFVSFALNHNMDYLPTSSSTYAKWFNEERNPEQTLWQALVNHFNEELLIDELVKNLNMTCLNRVASHFGVVPPSGENIDRESFAYAIAKQFYKIAQGNGTADNCVPSLYKPSILIFEKYAKKAEQKYSTIKMPFVDGYEERELEKIYVCNRLSNRKFTNKRFRTETNIIENVTLDILVANKYKKVKLIANGGVGKSMMMQHLFYHAIKQHTSTGKLPILAELRLFNSGKTILNYLVESVTRFGEKFDEKTLIKILEQGKCQIMLDGIDEIDPSDKGRYKNELSTLVDSYGDNQYIIASRDCEMADLIDGFMPLYIQSFDETERNLLIDNLLNDEPIKNEIKTFLSGNFAKDHPAFASNPMLITFVVAKYPLIDTYDNKKSLFYREIYKAVVFGHDEAKADYDRVFHSVQNGDEFTMVFKEFCTKTFMDGVHELDENDFTKYFGLITSKINLKNPYGFKMDGFKRDACATSCMMYQEQSKTFYIDKGFQELMFADYMQSIDEDKTREIAKDLWNKPYEFYNGGDAFEMLYEIDKKKVEYIMFIPYLKEIFKIKNEDSSFLKFMELSYIEFEYEVNDFELKNFYSSKTGKQWIINNINIIDSQNTIYSLLMHALRIDSHFGISTFGKEMEYPEIKINPICGQSFNNYGEDVLTTMPISSDIDTFESDHNLDNFLTNDGHLVLFGATYRIKFKDIDENKERYSNLLTMLKEKTGAAWTRYIKLKEYYDYLKKVYKDF